MLLPRLIWAVDATLADNAIIAGTPLAVHGRIAPGPLLFLVAYLGTVIFAGCLGWSWRKICA